jgi:hypothetical protein
MAGDESEQARAYVRMLRRQGRSDEDVREMMLADGWEEDELEALWQQLDVPLDAGPQAGRVRDREVLRSSWRAFVSNIWLLGGAGVVVVLAVGTVVVVAASLCLWAALMFILCPALLAGLCAMCLEAVRGQRPRIPRWREWWSRALPAIVVMIPLILAIAMSCAPLALALPIAMGMSIGQSNEAGANAVMRLAVLFSAGPIALAVVPLLGMALPAVADGRGARQALALSARRGLHNWPALAVLGVAIVAVQVLLLFASWEGIGLLVAAPLTLPLTAMVMSAAYLQAIGEVREARGRWP